MISIIRFFKRRAARRATDKKIGVSTQLGIPMDGCGVIIIETCLGVGHGEECPIFKTAVKLGHIKYEQ